MLASDIHKILLNGFCRKWNRISFYISPKKAKWAKFNNTIVAIPRPL